MLHYVVPPVNEDDMYTALDRCGMTVSEIYSLLDLQRPPGGWTDAGMVEAIQRMLFEKFERHLLDATLHKVAV